MVLVIRNSRSVVMEVEIRSGVCNNSPSETSNLKNGLRSSLYGIADSCESIDIE